MKRPNFMAGDELRRTWEEMRRKIREGARPFRELRTLVDLDMKE